MKNKNQAVRVHLA